MLLCHILLMENVLLSFRFFMNLFHISGGIMGRKMRKKCVNCEPSECSLPFIDRGITLRNRFVPYADPVCGNLEYIDAVREMDTITVKIETGPDDSEQQITAEFDKSSSQVLKFVFILNTCLTCTKLAIHF